MCFFPLNDLEPREYVNCQVLRAAKESGKAFDEGELRQQLLKSLRLHGLCPDVDQAGHLEAFISATLQDTTCAQRAIKQNISCLYLYLYIYIFPICIYIYTVHDS